MWAMTGSAPTDRVIWAQSATVTQLVMWCTSGACRRMA
jgi:hypothetical protein